MFKSSGADTFSLKKFFSFRNHSVPEGFTSINETCPQDVFIVGYPKSGNTWFQNLVAGVVHGVNPLLSPPMLASDLVPDVHYNKFYRRYSTPMFFKSHSLPRPEYRRVVYLLRDGRDAMVSYRHYQETMLKQKLDFFDFVTSGKLLAPCKWHQYVEAWEKNPYDAEILTIKYEDLVEQPVEQLERFCQFINLPRERDDLAAVAEAAQFNNLHDKEVRLGFGWPGTWPADKFFFRRGVIGSHEDEMPPKVLAAFLSEAGPTLRKHGYAVNQPVEEYAPSANGKPASFATSRPYAKVLG